MSSTHKQIGLVDANGSFTEYGNTNGSVGYITYPEFSINNNGHLIAEGGSGVDYTIDSNGHLIVTPL